MSKVPVSEAAEILGVTKEAVYNRIRRGTLKTFEKDGVKYVVLDGYELDTAANLTSNQPHKTFTEKSTKSAKSKKSKAGEFDVNEFLLSQISELKEQNQNLQADKERLFREKEQILLNLRQVLDAAAQTKLLKFENALKLARAAYAQQESFFAQISNFVRVQKDGKTVNLSELKAGDRIALSSVNASKEAEIL